MIPSLTLFSTNIKEKSVFVGILYAREMFMWIVSRPTVNSFNLIK